MRKLSVILALFLIINFQIFGTSLDSDNNTEESPNVEFGFQAGTFNERYLDTSHDDDDKEYEDAVIMANLISNFEEMKDYPLTPGDTFTLTIVYGVNTEDGTSTDVSYKIQLKEDYSLNLPLIGRIDTRGKNILQLQQIISEGISNIMPVQFVNFVLSSTASFKVLVYGGVNYSGYVDANPATKLTDILSDCKGFSDNASYRDIKLIRNGKEKSIDISRFYNNADKNSNPRLEPGDKIHVPMAKKMVTISGYIKFPGTYELLENEKLETLFRLAGGMTPGHEDNLIEITRIKSDGKTELIQTEIKSAPSFNLEDGDNIKLLQPYYSAETITVEGALYGEKTINKNSVFQAPTSSVKLEVPYYPGITLLNVLDEVGGPTPYAITDNAKIRHKEQKESEPIDITELWKNRDTKIDIELSPGDYVFIPIERDFVAIMGAVYVEDDDAHSNIMNHINGYTVMDYIIRSGGVDQDTANMNNIELISIDNKRKKIKLTDEVPPGSIIYINQNVLHKADDVFTNVFITTTWITTIVSAVTTILAFVNTYIVDLSTIGN
ncbi:MAG: SLBB domain-containing protein [Spirochaetales bacterium]|nr:SLBB domain-containing protein [Spirochaetales bacterium]